MTVDRYHKAATWLYALIIALLPFAVWITIGTEYFIRHVSLSVQYDATDDTYYGHFTRTTPWGDTSARWHTEIAVLDDNGRECSSGTWRWAEYQTKVGNVAKYDMGEWARPCLNSGHDVSVRTVRQAYLFGWIPLRPAMSVDYVAKETLR